MERSVEEFKLLFHNFEFDLIELLGLGKLGEIVSELLLIDVGGTKLLRVVSS
jgi:hypothetical protein